MHQIWYDDIESLTLKYQYAVKHGMKGVGMWDVDLLDYSNTTQGAKLRRDMWDALPKY